MLVVVTDLLAAAAAAAAAQLHTHARTRNPPRECRRDEMEVRYPDMGAGCRLRDCSRRGCGQSTWGKKRERERKGINGIDAKQSGKMLECIIINLAYFPLARSGRVLIRGRGVITFFWPDLEDDELSALLNRLLKLFGVLHVFAVGLGNEGRQKGGEAELK